jgi:hypothetical protein
LVEFTLQASAGPNRRIPEDERAAGDWRRDSIPAQVFTLSSMLRGQTGPEIPDMCGGSACALVPEAKHKREAELKLAEAGFKPLVRVACLSCDLH